MPKKIVAWDGEGVTYTDEGDHAYILFANSEADTITGTVQVPITLDQVIPLFMNYTKTLNIIYGGSYDVNMLLKGKSREWIEKLHVTGSNIHNGRYLITYKPRRQFSITDYKLDKTFTLWDVIGFFQSKFVDACKAWFGELKVLEDVEDMKLQRSTFEIANLDKIIEYNKTECQLLVLLFQALLDSFDEAGIPRIRRYDGAGAVASALMRQHKIQDHLGDEPLEVYEAAQFAYAGGRIETVAIGNGENSPIIEYDLNSAYPWAATELISYKDVKWYVQDNPTKIDIRPDGLYFIEWAPPPRTNPRFAPFFYRDAQGSITYPLYGKGWHWGCEVLIAKKYGWQVTCTKEYYPVYATDYRPFAFIEELYEKRAKFKAEGKMAHYSLKLGYNSIYGKLAQQLGFNGNRIPTYHQLLMAGLITAKVRARIYNKAMHVGEDYVIAFATDAIFARETEESAYSGNARLGDWQVERFDGMTIAQSGVYWLKSDKEWLPRYRGFDKDTISRESVVKAWKTGNKETKVKGTVTRFIGMAQALQLKAEDWDKWCSWQTTARHLDPWPDRKKRIAGIYPYHDFLCFTSPPLVGGSQGEPSSKYKVIWMDGESAQLLSNHPQIPAYQVEAEMGDSYE